MAGRSSVDEYFDLGVYSRPVRTVSPLAQLWFDRGLNWMYAFNHDEAAACFLSALEADPDCVMAYWGLAYALGPNYNKPWEAFEETELNANVKRTHDAVERGHRAAESGSSVERALISALRSRYPSDVPAEDCAIWNAPYADAMKGVYDAHPGDLDVAVLYADALMNLTPWQLWNLEDGEPAAGARTLEAKAVLDDALSSADGADHPGVLHLYIHLMEMSPTPEQALPVADRLRSRVPDGGHLQHMPSHLDVLCGDYRRVISGNRDAIRADERYVARRGAMNFYTLYRCHDYHFCIYGALFLGQSRVALDTVAELERAIPEELLRVTSPPMADWLEGFVSIRVHVLVRFGMWDELRALPLPEDAELYSATTAMIHYGKGVAASAIGDLARAEAEQRLFHDALAAVPESRMLFNNTCRDILSVGGAMLAGELEYRRGNIDDAFEHLRRAIDLDDNLPYDEPWGWMQPTRHAYGALLLEQGRVAEAVHVYESDLGIDGALPRALQHPGNVWSLRGYHEGLQLLGRTAEARIVAPQLALARAMADVPIEASCFCRINPAPQDLHQPGRCACGHGTASCTCEHG